MRKTVYNTIISLLILVILVSVFGVIDTQISLRYEPKIRKIVFLSLQAETFVYGLKVSKSSLLFV